MAFTFLLGDHGRVDDLGPGPGQQRFRGHRIDDGSGGFGGHPCEVVLEHGLPLPLRGIGNCSCHRLQPVHAPVGGEYVVIGNLDAVPHAVEDINADLTHLHTLLQG
ncbi:hypothetical protein MB46_14790 [Arthrobacter alpinus]|nr:hypothetical protein MB46_14790 [Arthrobacter alpinus]